MANITVAQFRDVAGGLQPGQFGIGDRVKIKGLSSLDPIYKALLDRPITVTLGLIDSISASANSAKPSQLPPGLIQDIARVPTRYRA